MKSHENDDGETTEDNEFIARKLMMRSQPGTGRNKNVNRYNLCFYQESKKELERLKLEGLKPFNPATPKQREIDASFYEGYDFPIRPNWSFDMEKTTLDRNENKYFRVSDCVRGVLNKIGKFYFFSIEVGF